MTELAFYTTALATGTVLGLGIGSRAEDVERILGSDFLDDPGRAPCGGTTVWWSSDLSGITSGGAE
ncbi:hypothetical protein GCM10022226_32850 [Sphaerisporangium flaviroseum]|uniref:Uncharacterized protein n=1 Tax=Sphaerisporangium flaviroseum TaxID=509199 RepID=A0ABP7I703_9ACTN